MVALKQGHHGAECRVDPRDRIADGHPDPHRWTVRVAHQPAQAADRLRDRREPGPLRQRPGLPERGDAGDDEILIRLVQYRGSEAPFLQGARPEVLQQHVAVPQQVEHDAASRFRAQVQHDRLLVPVDGPIQHRRATAVQPPVAQFVAGARTLDLDHLGTEVPENAARGGGGNVVAEFEYPHPGERADLSVGVHAPQPATRPPTFHRQIRLVLFEIEQYNELVLIRIDPNADAPLFEQIAASVRRAIADGSARSGTRLPGARELAESLDLNVHTVLRGYQVLRDEGLIELRRGRGAVVATDAGDRGALRSAVLAYVAAARRFGLSATEAARLVEAEMK